MTDKERERTEKALFTLYVVMILLTVIGLFVGGIKRADKQRAVNATHRSDREAVHQELYPTHQEWERCYHAHPQMKGG